MTPTFREVRLANVDRCHSYPCSSDEMLCVDAEDACGRAKGRLAGCPAPRYHDVARPAATIDEISLGSPEPPVGRNISTKHGIDFVFDGFQVANIGDGGQPEGQRWIERWKSQKHQFAQPMQFFCPLRAPTALI